jgi:hypothetical protein
MNCPEHKNVLVSFLEWGLIPIESIEGERTCNYWYLDDDAFWEGNKRKVPMMIFAIHGELLNANIVQDAIEYYLWATEHKPIIPYASLNTWVFHTEISANQANKSKLILQEFREYPADHSLWVKVSLAWINYAWYIQAREEMSLAKLKLDVLPATRPKHEQRILPMSLFYQMQMIRKTEAALKPANIDDKPFIFGKRP